MNELRIRIRGRWGSPRVINWEGAYPKYIYIKEPSGLRKAYKRIDHTASPGDYYRKGKYHEQYDQETGASYAEYEEIDKDILILESE